VADVQQSDPFEAREDPAHSRALGRVVHLAGDRLPGGGQLLARAVLGQRRCPDGPTAPRHTPLALVCSPRPPVPPPLWAATPPSILQSLRTRLRVAAGPLALVRTDPTSTVRHCSTETTRSCYSSGVVESWVGLPDAAEWTRSAQALHARSETAIAVNF